MSNVTADNCLEKGHPLHYCCIQAPGVIADSSSGLGWSDGRADVLQWLLGCVLVLPPDRSSLLPTSCMVPSECRSPWKRISHHVISHQPFLSAEMQEWALTMMIAAGMNHYMNCVHVPFAFSFYFHWTNKAITVLRTLGYAGAVKPLEEAASRHTEDAGVLMLTPFLLKNGVLIFAVLWS